MTSTPGPQDRLGDDRNLPGARANMPIIGENGIEADPATPSPTPRPAPSPTPQTPATQHSRAVDNVVSVFGDTRRSGRWRAGEKVRAYSVFGDVVLDLREAEFDGDEIVIESATLFGDTRVIVPPGTAVDLGGFTLFGDQKHLHRPGTPPPGFPRVRVTGWALFGDVQVRSLEIGEEEPTWWKRLSGN